MTRINLLPWRDTLEKERRYRFFIIAGVSLFVTVCVWLSVHFYMASEVGYQEDRNKYLQQKIKQAEDQIKEIENLDEQKQRVIERIDVIQELEDKRPQVVHFFDEIVRRVPDGVYFSSMKQKGDKIKLEGVAQSDARVSSLMGNIDQSKWLKTDKIISIERKEIQSKTRKVKRSVSLFKLEIRLTLPKKEETTP
ncbi:MAG: pilus assembly protein PilN [Candidatus Parabeggiatoa sp. nov. 3]|nr:MAG: pilus assembly protein PilN [Gammaproteobacteria bacterium]RKZ62892.1 MAG: pilus assembly protein PilN [Gammaproteobacteria bacterium]RKZ83806.1 MAG: pilus assembly protein PilN [Gammaproteobacteria bacterium]HEW98182.1 pilus assembly protein PilN [Beggiatoa sp.]